MDAAVVQTDDERGFEYPTWNKCWPLGIEVIIKLDA